MFHSKKKTTNQLFSSTFQCCVENSYWLTKAGTGIQNPIKKFVGSQKMSPMHTCASGTKKNQENWIKIDMIIGGRVFFQTQ